MQQLEIPIDEVIVEDRFRKDLGDIAKLAESIQRLGIILPLVINQKKVLLDGGRRYAAAKQLGLTKVNVVYRETLTEDEIKELELEANKNRKDFTWQEECLLIERIHRLRTQKSAIEGKKWGQIATANLFGINVRNVNYSLRLAKEISDFPTGEVAVADTPTEAWRIVMRREKESALAELASRGARQTAEFLGQPLEALSIAQNSPALQSLLPDDSDIAGKQSKCLESLEQEQARERYLSNPLNDPNDFEAYWKERQERFKNVDKRIFLSSWIKNIDCLEYMKNPENWDKFNHIITDPPYGIDMEMLNQGNDGHAFQNISTVVEEHQVEPNLVLLTNFIHLAYSCLKENGFCVLWCDAMNWQFLYDTAIDAGFKVQRWPFHWVKTHTCMNQSAHCNFTKATEIAIVMRKGKAVLAQHQPNNYILASHDELKDKLDHPFVKPFAVWERIIEAVSFTNEIILEPFSGRGSGVLSMLRLNRRVIALEVQQNHYNALLENVKQHYLAINPVFTFV